MRIYARPAARCSPLDHHGGDDSHHRHADFQLFIEWRVDLSGLVPMDDDMLQSWSRAHTASRRRDTMARPPASMPANWLLFSFSNDRRVLTSPWRVLSFGIVISKLLLTGCRRIGDAGAGLRLPAE